MNDSPENVARIRRALRVVPDQAVNDVRDAVQSHTVVRAADEVVVDLMAQACGLPFQGAVLDVDTTAVDAVEIPIAGKRRLIRTQGNGPPLRLG